MRLGHAQTVTVRTKLVNRLPVERLLRPDTQAADPDKTDTGPKRREEQRLRRASKYRQERAGWRAAFLVRRQPGVTRGSHVTPSNPNRDSPTITSRRPRQECGSHGVESDGRRGLLQPKHWRACRPRKKGRRARRNSVISGRTGAPGGIGDLRAGWTAGGIRGRRGVGGTDDVGEGGRRGRARVRVQKAVKVSGCTGGSDNGGRLGDIARRRERPVITSVPLPSSYE